MNSIYPWQQYNWQQLQALGAQLPHALLFHGQTGIGKVDFVRHLAQSLLCEQPLAEGHACGVCASCRWYLDRAHMDFRMLRPEVLDLADGLESEEGDAEGEAETGEKKSKKAPSKEIRIEQVRALAGFLNIGTHRGGRRIVVLYPLQAMNIYTANALLKMLEEPPPHTVFLLVADSLERVLPTILSRCRHIQMHMPQPAEALDWLMAQGAQGFAAAEAAQALAEQGGAPLAARALMTGDAVGDPAKSVELAAQRKRLLDYLSQPDRHDLLQVAEQLQTDVPRALGWVQRWLYDCISYSTAQRIRYYPGCEKEIVQIATLFASEPATGSRQTWGSNPLWALEKKLLRARRVVQHPLNARLFIENLLLDYAELIGNAGGKVRR